MSRNRIIFKLKAQLVILIVLASFSFLNSSESFGQNYNIPIDKKSNDLSSIYEETNPTHYYKDNFNIKNDTTMKTDVEFNHYNTCDSSTYQINIDDSEDWSTDSSFNFTDIRKETITNGNAEGSEDLFTDYIPSHYNGNITKEEDINNGEAISGDYSWYFDIKSKDYTTIAGFDSPINLSSNSVIFSFSYSLLNNSLGTFYDSNVCIRLFFQFDIYIFIWFNGNSGVLSNVTGPGGYADILVDEGSFDGEIHQFSLNITSLGLELFNQEPDQLRSFAVQTWGETSYDMAFSLDDISLTDLITPSEVGLTVNSISVIGNMGSGSIQIDLAPSAILTFFIQNTFTNLLYWTCDYSIRGFNTVTTQRNLFFNDYAEINWIDTLNFTLKAPAICDEVIFNKWIPLDWIVDDVQFDELSISYNIIDTNLTHKNVEIIIPFNNNILKCYYTSSNLIDNVILSSYEISHDDIISVFIQSQLFFETIEIFVLNESNIIMLTNTTVSDAFGDATLNNLKIENWYDRGNYSVVIKWQSETQAGLGYVEFELNTIPVEIVPKNDYILTNYHQDVAICVDFVDLENNETINQAILTYICEFSSGTLVQNGFNQYISTIQTEGINPGNYSIIVSGEKTGYASAHCTILLEINVSNLILTLTAPSTANPGDTIIPLAHVIDNQSNPIFNVSIIFRINNQLNSETWTNLSGYAKAFYPIPISYEYDNLNVSCSISINDFEYYFTKKMIIIEIFDIDRLVQLENPTHLSELNQDDSSYLYFSIRYPSIGEKWFANTPIGLTAKSAKIVSDIGNISAIISPTGNIYWNKVVSNSSIITDYLLLEIDIIEPVIEVDLNNEEVNIEIRIITDNIPFDGLPVKISLETDWNSFNKWDLYLNGSLVNDDFNLEISTNFITFNLYSTINTEEMILQLTGSKVSLISIAPSTIILGIGIVVLTVVSTILLSKKKTEAIPDIQV
ncbi:MAG: hypothetical protein ACTSO7_01710 [Candidatus Heimdallarchaeota archaeon]